MTIPEDCIVRLIDLPYGVGGFIAESPDGFLNIYINARHMPEKRLRSLRHELRHADADDLHSTDPVAVIEARACKKPSPAGEGGTAPAVTNEVPASSVLSTLLRARDLLPPPPPAPKPATRPLTPRQARVLMDALSDLDRVFFSDRYEY